MEKQILHLQKCVDKHPKIEHENVFQLLETTQS